MTRRYHLNDDDTSESDFDQESQSTQLKRSIRFCIQPNRFGANGFDDLSGDESSPDPFAESSCDDEEPYVPPQPKRKKMHKNTHHKDASHLISEHAQLLSSLACQRLKNHQKQMPDFYSQLEQVVATKGHGNEVFNILLYRNLLNLSHCFQNCVNNYSNCDDTI